ncbi:MAG: DUF1801 domain-containing protein [Saprospiraceae bacterium]|nr:DUF1801 domain-containing protein [Saprospiraceae bacterium]
MNTAKPETIDQYIADFPAEVQQVLEEVRSTIRQMVPDARECISYGIPTFDMDKSHLVHFAGFKQHIGLYPTPTGMEAFKTDLAPYKQGKGSVQFPLDQPMPLDLIRKIVEYRMEVVRGKISNQKK